MKVSLLDGFLAKPYLKPTREHMPSQARYLRGCRRSHIRSPRNSNRDSNPAYGIYHHHVYAIMPSVSVLARGLDPRTLLEGGDGVQMLLDLHDAQDLRNSKGHGFLKAHFAKVGKGRGELRQHLFQVLEKGAV